MDLTVMTVAELEAQRGQFADKLEITRKLLRQYTDHREREAELRHYEFALACMDTVIAARQPRPIWVCLCGSTRFYQQFQEANYQETLAGRVVLTVGFYPHSTEQAHGETIGITPEQKQDLDELHLRKIDAADEILVINCDGYIGDSTRREIAYAVAHNKPVRWWDRVNVPPELVL